VRFVPRHAPPWSCSVGTPPASLLCTRGRRQDGRFAKVELAPSGQRVLAGPRREDPARPRWGTEEGASTGGKFFAKSTARHAAEGAMTSQQSDLTGLGEGFVGRLPNRHDAEAPGPAGRRLRQPQPVRLPTTPAHSAVGFFADGRRASRRQVVKTRSQPTPADGTLAGRLPTSERYEPNRNATHGETGGHAQHRHLACPRRAPRRALGRAQHRRLVAQAARRRAPTATGPRPRSTSAS
jgi:hypothetical protein